MKKAIASVLAASMALSLAACGGSSTATSSSTPLRALPAALRQKAPHPVTRLRCA